MIENKYKYQLDQKQPAHTIQYHIYLISFDFIVYNWQENLIYFQIQDMPKTPNFQHYTQTLSIPITSMLTQKSLLNKTKTIAKKCHLKKGQDEETLFTLALMIRQKFEITKKFKEPNDTTEVYQQFCGMFELSQKGGCEEQVVKKEVKELVKEKLDLVSSMLSTFNKNQNKNNKKGNDKRKKKKAENSWNENEDENLQQKERKQAIGRILNIIEQEQEKLSKIVRQAENQQEAIMCQQEEQFFK